MERAMQPCALYNSIQAPSANSDWRSRSFQITEPTNVTRAEVIQMRALRTRYAPTFAKWNFVRTYANYLIAVTTRQKNYMIYVTVHLNKNYF